MKKLGFVFVLAMLLALSACSGSKGGTSSGGGGSGSNTPGETSPPVSSPDEESPSENQYAGTYSGTANMTVTGLGTTLTDSAPVVITIGTDGTITLNGEMVGTLNGNTFAITQTATRTIDEFTCSGTAFATGSISGNTINGTFSTTTLNCNGIPLEFSGSFTAKRS